MEPTAAPPTRNFIMQIFVSPGEPRLRAGWRILLHTLLLGFVTGLFLLVSLALPVTLGGGSLDTSFQALIIELLSIVIATWLARRLIDRRSFRSLGFDISKQSWIDLGLGFAIPAVLMGLMLAVELALGWTTFDGWAWQSTAPLAVLTGLSSGLLAFTLVGFSEEILSRGYHLQNLRDGLSLNGGILISSGIFAILHAANPGSSWISTLGILFAGIFLAYGWVRTHQLWLSIGLHIGWNFFEGNIFGFPVSGLPTFRLIEHTTTGPTIITGGEFGPEAGLIVLPAMALGIFLINRFTKHRQPTPSSTT